MVKRTLAQTGTNFSPKVILMIFTVGYDEGAGHATIKASCFLSQQKMRNITSCLKNMEGVTTETQKCWKPLVPLRLGRKN